jgi:tetratricopeptide (TPR) repeat protein
LPRWEFDPNLPEAHLAQGQLYKLRFNWIAAEEEIREALRLNPSVPGGHATHAWTLASMGRYDEALAAARRALSLDPLSPDTYEAMALVQYCLQDYESAIRSGEKMGEWGANPMLVASRLGWFYLAKSQYDKALELWEKVGLRADLAVLYTKTGRLEDARRILAQVEAAGTGSFAWPLIEIHLALGENEEAIHLLECAYDNHDAFAFTLLNIAHIWGGVRSDPRVVRLAEKTGLR